MSENNRLMMSEFINTMKKWRKMCDYCVEQYGDESCRHCPLDGKNCGAIWETDVDGLPEIEEKVNAWNEPAFPTWGELLRKFYAATAEDCETFNEWLNTTVVPPDTAKKLGLEPKT